MAENTVYELNNGIVVFEPPMPADRYKFLFEHLDCDSIVDDNNDVNNNDIKIIAYAVSKDYNMMLQEYFDKRRFSGKYYIMQGIDNREVNCI